MNQLTEFKIKGPKLFTLNKFSDQRGFFTERFKDQYKEILGIQNHFIQDNFSRSVKNVVRGLHMQHSPGQGKIVTCLNGHILDVIVDVRKGSPTYGSHLAIELSGDDPALFWVPSGFAHGFSVLSDVADVMYKVDSPYNSKNELSILWNDAELAIDWKVNNPVLSPKDLTAPTFSEYKKNPQF